MIFHNQCFLELFFTFFIEIAIIGLLTGARAIYLNFNPQ